MHYNQLVLEIYRAVWEETQQRMASVHLSKDSTQGPVSDWGGNVRKQLGDLLSMGLLPRKWRTDHLSSLSPPTASYNPTVAFVVAQRLVQRHWLLVFDEVQLLDVSSATLLADVLSWFWRMGGVVVGTSNKVPDDLYKNGVQKERLQPFVEALKIRSPVFTMKTSNDWRMVKAGATAESSWYTKDQQSAFQQAISDAVDKQPVLDCQLHIFDRSLRIPWCTKGACRFSFSELCEKVCSILYQSYISHNLTTTRISDQQTTFR
jgi:protein AFG1